MRRARLSNGQVHGNLYGNVARGSTGCISSARIVILELDGKCAYEGPVSIGGYGVHHCAMPEVLDSGFGPRTTPRLLSVRMANAAGEMAARVIRLCIRERSADEAVTR